MRSSQPLHPLARLRQNASRGRWYTTRSQAFQRTRETLRAYTTFPSSSASRTPGLKYNRAAFPVSQTRTFVTALPGRSPFAHTLRPNLTGGTLNRTAGGYSLGGGRVGGQRYFSHGPAAPAQVVQNVSQAVRAFWLNGSKAQYDGVDKRGNKRFRAVSATKDKVMRKLAATGIPKQTPGSYVDFYVNPTITAITSLSSVAGFAAAVEDDVEQEQHAHLNSTGLLDVLHTDFSRSLSSLSAILRDLTRLASLGDLPITYENTSSGPSLRIHFPGTDADTVERLCSEMNVTRGVVGQDEGFDAFVGSEIALMFPFAPSKAPSVEEEDTDKYFRDMYEYKRGPIDWRNMLESSVKSDSPGSDAEEHAYIDFEVDEEDISMHSEQDLSHVSEDEVDFLVDDNPWLSSPEGYASGVSGYGSRLSSLRSPAEDEERSLPLEYQDFEGIRRFIEMCDDAGAGRGSRLT